MFRENNIDYERINYFIEPLTEAKLRDLLRKLNLSAFEVVRTKESVCKELKISAETPADEIIKLMVENPALLQRPIVEFGDRAVLARPIEKAIDLINSKG